MSRSAYFDKEARNYLVNGLDLVADCVKSTLGPGGNTCVIQRKDKTPLITKDGVSVAKEIRPKDEKLKLGADLAISIAKKQLNSVGDGTTTATILGQALVKEGIRQIELCDTEVNLTSFKKGLNLAKDKVIEYLDKNKYEIKNEQDLVNIATISANGDEKLGDIVAKAYNKVGKDGVVLIEETKDRDTYLEFKEGMTFNKGWTSQYFVNNFQDQTVEFDKPNIVLCDTKVSNFQMLARLIEPIATKGEPVVIIAESFDSSVTQGLAMNIMRSNGAFKIACVEAPSFGQRRLDILRDLGIYLDAEVGDDPMGTSFETMTTASFGKCEKIIIKRDETIIRGGIGDKKAIEERIEAIKGEISACKDNDGYEKEQLGKRLASLTTGVAVIKVGGSSEEEIKELKDRLDDAQWAVKAALEEGYVPGAGTMLLRAAKLPFEKFENDSMRVGQEVLIRALQAPTYNILKNAGIDKSEFDILKKHLENSKDLNLGYDARNKQETDLLKAGVIDPVKVVKGAIYAAVSIAGVVLTSKVIITEDPEEEKDVNLSMMGMPGM